MSKIVDVNGLFSKYYKNDRELLATVLKHSEMVAGKALACAEIKGLDIDREFVYTAALLHDIGVVKCHAPKILCYGSKPYICHGVEGARILRDAGLPRHALVCERHTGSGLPAEYIKKEKMPLPIKDMLPLSVEEKLICYADKFYSKSGDVSKEKSVEEIAAQMEKFGKDSLNRFLDLQAAFG